MAGKDVYYIKIRGALVQVTEDVYLEYFRTRRRWYAQGERDTYNNVVSYNAMDNEEMLGEEMIFDVASPSVEDLALDELLRKKLHDCLAELSKPDQEMLQALYFDGLSERQLAQRLGIHHMTVHNQKVRLLGRLREMMSR